MENFSRRSFLSTAAKFAAGAAIFGLIPETAEAAKKKKKPPAEIEKIENFVVPRAKEFKTLDELNIGEMKLDFVSDMDVREYTGAIVVHHTAQHRNGDLDVPTIHDMHVGNGWAGIGYHFVIHRDGFIETGRPLKFVGAHSYGNNAYTVGICLTGNFDRDYPTTEQVLSAEQLIAALCHKYKFEPCDTTIFGHRELNDTSCPGSNFFPYLPEVIFDARMLTEMGR